MTGIRVATYNVWGWYYPNGRAGGKADPTDPHPLWRSRAPVVAAALLRAAPDVVALQEGIDVPGYRQARQALGADFHVVHAERREPDGTGAVIASRWPITAVQELDLQVNERTADFAAVTLIAEIDAPDPVGPILFANHNNNWQLSHEYERCVQAATTARVLEGMAERTGRHVVLAGDFNASPDASCMRFWRGLEPIDGTSVSYRDAWLSTHPDDPGHTFTPDNPLVRDGTWPQETGRRIDYLFVRCAGHGPSLAVTECDLIGDRPAGGVWPSDHFGVVARLSPPD